MNANGGHIVPYKRSVYFKVKTLIKAATERKAPKGRKKTLFNFDDTERDQKAKKMPKELKPLITEIRLILVVYLFNVSFLVLSSLHCIDSFSHFVRFNTLD